jgi:hypothetical protein
MPAILLRSHFPRPVVDFRVRAFSRVSQRGPHPASDRTSLSTSPRIDWHTRMSRFPLACKLLLVSDVELGSAKIDL